MKNCDLMFSTISGQSLLPLLLPRCCEGLALFLRYVLHRKQQRPIRVPVVNRLDEMTRRQFDRKLGALVGAPN